VIASWGKLKGLEKREQNPHFSPYNGLFTIRKTSARSSELVAAVSDYLIWFAKDRQAVKYRELNKPKELSLNMISQYGLLEIEGK
jgi:hypothetical protein